MASAGGRANAMPATGARSDGAVPSVAVSPSLARTPQHSRAGGAGPGGAATALALAATAPALAARTLLLDKARHPRDKTCAGGVIPKALRLLDELGVGFDVPHVRVDAATVAVPGGNVVVATSDL